MYVCLRVCVYVCAYVVFATCVWLAGESVGRDGLTWCYALQGRRAVMVTMCGVLENEGAQQMAAALIKWPVMMASMQQVCLCCVAVFHVYDRLLRYDLSKRALALGCGALCLDVCRANGRCCDLWSNGTPIWVIAFAASCYCYEFGQY